MTSPTHVLISEHGSKFYESANNVREMCDLGGMTFSHLEWDTHAWPGGYPIYYITKDGGILCPRCANEHINRTIDPDDDQFYILAGQINYEDHDLYCDHCNEKIEEAYGEDDEEDNAD